MPCKRTCLCVLIFDDKKPNDQWKCETLSQYAGCGTKGPNAVQYNPTQDTWSPWALLLCLSCSYDGFSYEVYRTRPAIWNIFLGPWLLAALQNQQNKLTLQPATYWCRFIQERHRHNNRGWTSSNVCNIAICILQFFYVCLSLLEVSASCFKCCWWIVLSG